MKFLNKILLIYFFVGFFAHNETCGQFIGSAQAQNNTQANIPNVNSDLNISNSYKEKLKSFISAPRGFAILAAMISYKLSHDNKDKAQSYTNEFKHSVLQKAKENYVDLTYKFYLLSFGNIFTEEEFDSISGFLTTKQGTLYAINIASTILSQGPTLAPIPKEELVKIDKYLVTYNGKKLKEYYPVVIQQIQKPLMAYINRWVENVKSEFSTAGKKAYMSNGSPGQ